MISQLNERNKQTRTFQTRLEENFAAFEKAVRTAGAESSQIEGTDIKCPEGSFVSGWRFKDLPGLSNGTLPTAICGKISIASTK
jgi:hypothetical protein